MHFTYYSIIGKDLNLLKGHVNNIKDYAGFDKLECDKEFIMIVYRNERIPPHVTQSIVDFCNDNDVRVVFYDEPDNVFLTNLYACWNLGYEAAKDGYVFRGGSDQIFSKDSFVHLYNVAEKLQGQKVTLHANTIECASRLAKIGSWSRHFTLSLGETYEEFDYKEFENFISNINAGVTQEYFDVYKALQLWNHPTSFLSSMGVINRCDGNSWLMTREDWVKHGPLPVMFNNTTGDCVINDILQQNGYMDYIVRDCITYHFVQGESTGY